MMDTEHFFRHVGLVGYSVRELKSVLGQGIMIPCSFFVNLSGAEHKGVVGQFCLLLPYSARGPRLAPRTMGRYWSIVRSTFVLKIGGSKPFVKDHCSKYVILVTTTAQISIVACWFCSMGSALSTPLLHYSPIHLASSHHVASNEVHEGWCCQGNDKGCSVEGDCH